MRTTKARVTFIGLAAATAMTLAACSSESSSS